MKKKLLAMAVAAAAGAALCGITADAAVYQPGSTVWVRHDPAVPYHL